MKNFRNISSTCVMFLIMLFVISMLSVSNVNGLLVNNDDNLTSWTTVIRDEQESKCLSEVTLSVSATKTHIGSPVTISGTVIDVSSSILENDDLKLRFPNGVPVVSDEILNQWMRYIYEQHEQPAEIIGVKITVYVTSDDIDEGLIEIGTTTTDAHGIYSIVWTPENEGEYDIWVTFETTDGYYGSHAQTKITISPSPFGWYIIGTAITIIAIIIVATLFFTKINPKK